MAATKLLIKFWLCESDGCIMRDSFSLSALKPPSRCVIELCSLIWTWSLAKLKLFNKIIANSAIPWVDEKRGFMTLYRVGQLCVSNYGDIAVEVSKTSSAFVSLSLMADETKIVNTMLVNCQKTNLEWMTVNGLYGADVSSFMWKPHQKLNLHGCEAKIITTGIALVIRHWLSWMVIWMLARYVGGDSIQRFIITASHIGRLHSGM